MVIINFYSIPFPITGGCTHLLTLSEDLLPSGSPSSKSQKLLILCLKLKNTCSAPEGHGKTLNLSQETCATV